MVEGLSVQGLNRWCKKISNEVRTSAPQEYKEKIVLEAIETSDKRLDIKFSVPRETVPLVESSIRRNLSQMPITTKSIFEMLLKQIEERGGIDGFWKKASPYTGDNQKVL